MMTHLTYEPARRLNNANSRKKTLSVYQSWEANGRGRKEKEKKER